MVACVTVEAAPPQDRAWVCAFQELNVIVVVLATALCVALALLVLVYVGVVKQGREVPFVPRLGEWLLRMEKRLNA